MSHEMIEPLFRQVNRVAAKTRASTRPETRGQRSDIFAANGLMGGAGKRLLGPLATVGSTERPIRCRERFGGVINLYHREAA